MTTRERTSPPGGPGLLVGAASVFIFLAFLAGSVWGMVQVGRSLEEMTSTEDRSVLPIVLPPGVMDDIAPATPLNEQQLRGRKVFMTTCHNCHGDYGRGIPNVGANLRESKFIPAHSDADLVAFITRGRQPTDPDSVLHLLMPPKGLNPALQESDLYDVVAYLRTIQAATTPPTATASK